jgi:hypothetical protein
VQSGPAIPKAEILNEQVVTNLFDPNEVELKDINKLQARPYGNIMSKNPYIQNQIQHNNNNIEHHLTSNVRPFERNLMKELIYSRRNNLPSLKSETIFNQDVHNLNYSNKMLDKVGNKKDTYKQGIF